MHWQDRVDTALWDVYYRAQPYADDEGEGAQALGWDRVTEEMRRDRRFDWTAQAWTTGVARL